MLNFLVSKDYELHLRERGNMYTTLTGKCKGMKPLEYMVKWWKNTIQLNLKEHGTVVCWILLAGNNVLENPTINLWVS
jgi:hypothetical protein